MSSAASDRSLTNGWKLVCYKRKFDNDDPQMANFRNDEWKMEN